MYMSTVYICCIRTVACNECHVQLVLCNYTNLQLHVSHATEFQLQNPKFLVLHTSNFAPKLNYNYFQNSRKDLGFFVVGKLKVF